MKLLSSQANLGINKSRILSVGLVAFIGGILLGTVLLSFTKTPVQLQISGQSLAKFASYAELVSFVNTSSSHYYPPGMYAFDIGTSGRGETALEHSTTNIQVAGVDEADIVKTDGEYIYVASNNSIFVVDANPDEAATISQVKPGGVVQGIFVNEFRLVVLATRVHETTIVNERITGYRWPISESETFIRVYDVSKPESPTLTRNVTLDGFYFNSRMIGDHVYVVVNEPALLNASDVRLPRICLGGDVHDLQATDIYYFNFTDYGYVFTTIAAINVRDDAEKPNHETFLLGATRNMYVSVNNIYMTLRDGRTGEGVERTVIHRVYVDKGNVIYQASGEVPGHLLNQFSMDEHGDHFRIATTTGSVWSGSKNNVYVLNMSLEVVGKLEGLAPGEEIYSTRFMGDRCYVVTFRKVDPLFVIDLQEPENPEVLGQLKITGYSSYLHPYDEDHIIGVGKETVADDWGDFAWYQGVKISLFDVSNVSNPLEMDKDEIGDRGTDSPVLRDHKALLLDTDRELLVIPVLVAEIEEARFPEGVPPDAYGDYVWQGAYVYSISASDLELRGNITHIESGSELPSSYYLTSSYIVNRALYIGNVLYTISDKRIKMNDLDSLDELGEVELP